MSDPRPLTFACVSLKNAQKTILYRCQHVCVPTMHDQAAVGVAGKVGDAKDATAQPAKVSAAARMKGAGEDLLARTSARAHLFESAALMRSSCHVLQSRHPASTFAVLNSCRPRTFGNSQQNSRSLCLPSAGSTWCKQRRRQQGCTWRRPRRGCQSRGRWWRRRKQGRRERGELPHIMLSPVLIDCWCCSLSTAETSDRCKLYVMPPVQSTTIWGYR